MATLFDIFLNILLDISFSFQNKYIYFYYVLCGNFTKNAKWIMESKGLQIVSGN